MADVWPLPCGMGRCVCRTGRGHPDGLHGCGRRDHFTCISPNGRFVLPRGTTYRNGTQLSTRVYQATSGQAAGPLLDSGGILLNAAFSPDGTRVATANSAARTIAARSQVQFEPDGKGGNVQLWDWKSGRRLAGPIPTPGEPRGLAFRPDGKTLAVVCADYRILLVDALQGTITHHLDPGIRTRTTFRDANFWYGNGEAQLQPGQGASW